MPDSPDHIRALKAKRFAYLNYVYEDWQRVPAGTMQALNADDVRIHLRLDRDEADRIMEYLKGRDLIKYISHGPQIRITPYGIDYVEGALAEPDQPTEYFPAVNVLHIEQVINSQIQQGTANSTQRHEWQGVSTDQLASIISEIQGTLSAATLPDVHRRELRAAVATLEAQATLSKPNNTIVREALTSVRAIAEAVGAALLAGKIGTLLGMTAPL